MSVDNEAECESGSASMTNALSKIMQSINDIGVNLHRFVHVPPSQMESAQRVFESLIGKLGPLLLKVNEKIKKSEVCDWKEPIQSYEEDTSDSGNSIKKHRRSKRKLDPLSRANQSMSTSIGKLEELIAAVHPHPINVEILIRVKATVDFNIMSLNACLKVLNERIEEWEKFQNKFNGIINEFGKFDKTTADQIQNNWVDKANGDKSAHSKAITLIYTGIEKYRGNESVIQVLEELHEVYASLP